MIEPRSAHDHISMGRPSPAATPAAEQMAVALGALAASRAGGQTDAVEERAREAVRRYVVHEKREGGAPEQVLVAVKVATRRAALGLPAHDPVTGIEELTALVVSWCIADYYRAD